MMTLDTAKRILSEEIAKLGTDGWPDDLLIEFLGGEPFINFHLIKDVCEWLWNTYNNKNFALMCRTNGTCLSSEACDWLELNKDRISVGLSLDGLPELQELNRRGSIRHIPIDFFIRNWPQEEIKSVISPQGVYMLAESAISFCEKKWNFSMSLAAGVDWPETSVSELGKQLDILIEYLIENPNVSLIKGLFVEDFITLCLPIDETRENMCGAYNEIVAYGTEGQKFCCHIFSDITLGKKMSEYYSDESHMPKKLKLDESCRECPAHALCKVCPGFNLIAGNEMNIQDKRVCKSIKTLFWANCKLYLLKNQEKAFAGKLSQTEWACMKFALANLNH